MPVIEAKLNIEIYETQPNITLINCYKSSFLCSSTFGSFSESKQAVAGSVQLSQDNRNENFDLREKLNQFSCLEEMYFPGVQHGTTNKDYFSSTKSLSC